MFREMYFCNMWSTDLIWHTVRELLRRHKISVNVYYSAKDNARIQTTLSIVLKKPQIKNGEGVRRGGPVYLGLGICGTCCKSSIQDIVDEVAPIKKSPPMGLKADSFECDITIQGL